MSLPEKPKISLAMIVRNSSEHLAKTLDSIKDHVDEIVIVDTGSTDNTVEIARRYTDRVEYFEWIKDFSAARNYSFSKCSNDIILWLDDDDTVISGESMCDWARAAFSLGVTELWVDYDYTHDRHGNCRTRQRRERFLHKQIYEWRGRVHEAACAKYLLRQELMDRERGYIKHSSYIEDEVDHNMRVKRNLEIMQEMEKQNALDHRMTFFYANTLRAVGKFAEAVTWYRRYLASMERSMHWYAAMVNMVRCLFIQGKMNEMRNALIEAIAAFPKYASAYMFMAQCYAMDKDWDRALEWADEAVTHQDGVKYELMYDPSDIAVVPHTVRCGAYIAQARFEEARKELEFSLRHYPDNEGLIYFQNVIAQSETKARNTDAYLTMKHSLIAEGRENELETLAEIAPQSIRYLADVLKHKKRHRRTDRPSIGIFCPINWEPWGPKSLYSGIGGSETAVIHMAVELDKLGWDVTVYAHTKDIGTIDGIHWTHYLGYNDQTDHHDVMITWRDPRSPMTHGQNCKISIFWAHDIFNESHWLLEPELCYDKIFVLSDYHKELFLQRIPESLLYVTRNGTDPRFWKDPANQPHKVIYTSCPSRGLIYLLREWTFVTDQVPDAELHIYYGWNKAFEAAMATHPEAARLYNEVEQLKRAPGIIWHGRVGKDELGDAYASSQVWAYPCHFPEISAIVGMEAQIHGCTPVIRNHAALKETVQYGRRLDLPDIDRERAEQVRYVTELVEELKNPTFTQKEEMIQWARSTYRWDSVAKDWDQLFRQLLSSWDRDTRRIEPGKMPQRQRALSLV